MISQWVRTWYSKVLNPFLEILMWLGITPNMVTILSMLTIIVAGILFAIEQPVVGAWVLLFGGFLDGVDGALARITKAKSPFGAFLDSICDHCGDFAVYLGLLISSLRHGSVMEIVLLFVAMFASVFGSHVRSRAGMLAIETKTIGIFTRFERIFLLFICILLGKVILALWGLAIFNSLSALQRVIYTIRMVRSQATPAQSIQTL
jgi:phosphatidylglycerophosphate synthase